MSQDASVTPGEGTSSVVSGRELVRVFVELAKPGVTRLVILTTFLGVAAAPVPFRADVLFFALVGTSLVVAGANALNMFLERDTDRFMSRTMSRPLPSGRLSPDLALGFGVIVSMLGLLLLAEGTTMLALVLAALALLSYVLVYTPMKRLSPTALYVGAVPGALPPAIGYAAAAGGMDRLSLSLFSILFVWQLPHFLAISIFRRTEYAKASLLVFPNTLGLSSAKKLTVFLAALLLGTTLAPYFLGIAGLPYLAIALVSGVAFLSFASYGLGERGDDAWAKKLFFSSMPHLVLVMSALVLSAG